MTADWEGCLKIKIPTAPITIALAIPIAVYNCHFFAFLFLFIFKLLYIFALQNPLYQKHQALENEYRNLQLQEATESDNTRVESIAIGTLKMQRVQSEQEVVIFE